MGHRLDDTSPRAAGRPGRLALLCAAAAAVTLLRYLCRANRRAVTVPRTADRSGAPVALTGAEDQLRRPNEVSAPNRRHRSNALVTSARAGAAISAPPVPAAMEQTPRLAPPRSLEAGAGGASTVLVEATLELEEAVTLPGFFDDLNALPVGPPSPGAWDDSGEAASTRTGLRTRIDRRWLAALALVGAVALALRLINHSSNYDLFIDEIEYSSIGQSVALGHGVTLFGSSFFLHPPLFFYLEALILDLFGGAHAAPVQLVLALRPINCVIGAIECMALTQLVSWLTGRRAGLAVGAFAAVDPFLLLWDGRVLLETQAMTLAVLGWLCLARISRRAPREPRGAVGSFGPRLTILLGGLCFGASLLSKETYAFVGVVPLAGMLLLGTPLPRRVSGAMLAIAAGCYAAYLLTVGWAGALPAWWAANSVGLQRALGVKQITGFNRSGGHSSLSGSITDNLSLYLVSYLVVAMVAIAAVVGVIRWFRAGRSGEVFEARRRLAITLGAGAIGYVGYAVLFGAFETQIFYMGVLGGLPVLATELSASRWSRSRARWSRRRILITLTALGCLALGFELAADIRLRVERDTSIAELVSYVQSQVPAGALVDSTDGVSQFVLRNVRIDGAFTVAAIERDQPAYVVLAPGLVERGFDEYRLGDGFQAWLHRHGQLVFAATGRSSGLLELYRTPYAGDAPAAP